MAKTKVGEEMPQKEAVISLAFRVKAVGDNLYAAEMLMLENDQVIASRHGISTTLGHAIGAADDLLDGWAFGEIETEPRDYYANVML